MEDQIYGPSTRDDRSNNTRNDDDLLLSTLLGALRRAGSTSRSDLVRKTGLGKALVAQYTELLLQNGIVVETGIGKSQGGRPPRIVRFAGELGLIGAVDLGATSVDVALTNLRGKVLVHHSEVADVRDGPAVVLNRVAALLNEMLAGHGFSADDLWGIGVGVPGPVEFSAGILVSPPIMPGWSNYSVRGHLQNYFACPVYVDNDVNIQAVGEATAGLSAGVANCLFIKLGTGIGAGIILNGHLYRGSQGCAGDLGHIEVDLPEAGHAVCRCGNINCLEALAGGAALATAAEEAVRSGLSSMLAERLNEQSFLAAEDIGEMASKGDAWSNDKIRWSGRIIGYSVAAMVSFLNPSLIIIGGGLSNFGDRFLAAIREMVYGRSLPLATRSLRIERSHLGSRAGVTGAAHIVLDELFSPESVTEVLEAHRGVAPAVSVSA